MLKRGNLTVIEGGDGSGKTTQFNLLVKLLRQKGVNYRTFKFPRHNKPFFGKMVDEYLNNSFGAADKVHPKLASLLYALDRWEAKDKITNWLQKGYWVLLDRYVTSNMGHQLGKIKSAKHQREFLSWLVELEYNVLKIPRPDRVLFLDMPVEFSLKLMQSRVDKKYIKGKLDGHENRFHLENTRRAYLFVAKQQPEWSVIKCVDKGKLLSPQAINKNIRSVLGIN